MLELTLTVTVVIVVSGLCSLSEAVLYSVPRSHIESLAQSGSKTGRILRRLRTNVDKPIAALLSLNTIANTAGAAVAGVLADHVLGTRWLGLFSAGLTLAILLLSEIIPKTAGVVYNRRLAGFIARPLALLVTLFAPLVWLSGRITRGFGADRRTSGITDEEIAIMTRLGLKDGAIDEDEALVIHNILELENKTVRDVLTPRTVLFALSGDETVGDVRREPKVLTHSRIPVFFKGLDDIGGLVHRRDLLNAVAEDRFELKLEHLMKPVHFVPVKMPLNRTLNMFLNRGEHMFIALDEFGGTAGVITLEDVLEEILGKEIVDEFDEVTDLRALAERRRRQAMDSELKRKR